MKLRDLAFLLFAAMVSARAASAAPDLVVHEWGTFTSFQDEKGSAFTGINAEDEPLPDFCHKIRWSGAVESSDFQSKAASRGHPDITMRLETPVIYFHPPREMKLPLAVNVDVQFRGGWLRGGTHTERPFRNYFAGNSYLLEQHDNESETLH